MTIKEMRKRLPETVSEGDLRTVEGVSFRFIRGEWYTEYDHEFHEYLLEREACLRRENDELRIRCRAAEHRGDLSEAGRYSDQIMANWREIFEVRDKADANTVSAL